MVDGPVTYDVVQDLLRSERRSNRLVTVPPRFWRDVRQLLTDLETAFREGQEKDPFSRRVIRLTDEVKNARNAAEGLWALRERKLALHALASEPKPPEGITGSEQALFDQLVKAFADSRATVFEGTSAEAVAAAKPPATASPPSSAPTQPSPSLPGASAAPPATPSTSATATPVKAAAAKQEAPPAAKAEPPAGEATPAGEPAPASPAPVVTVPPDTPGDDSVLVRALQDLPPFVGPDMVTYELMEGDVASVPGRIAALLIRGNRAAVVDAA